MQLQKSHIYAALLLTLLLCLNGQSEKVVGEASDYIKQGKAKFFDEDDYAGAISDFETAIGIKSDHALAYYARGLAKQARGGDDTGDGIAAEADFQKARTLKPDVEKLHAFGIGGGK